MGDRVPRQSLSRALGRRVMLSTWPSACQDCARHIYAGEPVAWAAGTAACVECARTLRHPDGAGPWTRVPAAFDTGRCTGCQVAFTRGQPIMWASRTLCTPCAGMRLLRKAGVVRERRSAAHQAVVALVLLDVVGGGGVEDVERRAASALVGEL